MHNYTQPTKESCLNNDYFPVGSIVSINGYDFDYGRFRTRENAPNIYGCVENPKNFDEECA